MNENLKCFDCDSYKISGKQKVYDDLFVYLCKSCIKLRHTGKAVCETCKGKL